MLILASCTHTDWREEERRKREVLWCAPRAPPYPGLPRRVHLRASTTLPLLRDLQRSGTVRACLRRPEFQIVESEAAETLQPVGVEAEGPRAEHRVEEEPADSSGVDVNKTCWWRGWLRRRVTLPRSAGIDSRWPRRRAWPRGRGRRTWRR